MKGTSRSNPRSTAARRALSRKGAPARGRLDAAGATLVAASIAAILAASSAFALPLATPKSESDNQPSETAALSKTFRGDLPITELTEDQAILHALNRLAYGPRPGDVERVRQMGLAKWIDQQLNPNSIDDKALEARLGDYPTLRMSTTNLMEQYPQPKQAEKEAAKRAQAQLEQQQQSRSDAAAAVVAKDMEADLSARETA